MNFRKIKQFINYKKYLDKIHRGNDDAYALQIIYKLFPDFTYLPFTPFSLNPYTIVHILNDILLNDRKQIVEFGSGLSTIIIAQFIKINNLKTRILSIDNNKDWQNIIFKEVKKHGSSESLSLTHAEIVKNDDNEFIINGNESWYDNEAVRMAIAKIDNIDLLVVDGPSTVTSAFVRYPAYISVKDKLASSYCIFLDDIRRNAEREIIQKWNDNIRGQLQIEKMYATISVGESFSSRPLSH